MLTIALLVLGLITTAHSEGSLRRLLKEKKGANNAEFVHDVENLLQNAIDTIDANPEAVAVVQPPAPPAEGAPAAPAEGAATVDMTAAASDAVAQIAIPSLNGEIPTAGALVVISLNTNPTKAPEEEAAEEKAKQEEAEAEEKAKAEEEEAKANEEQAAAEEAEAEEKKKKHEEEIAAIKAAGEAAAGGDPAAKAAVAGAAAVNGVAPPALLHSSSKRRHKSHETTVPTHVIVLSTIAGVAALIVCIGSVYMYRTWQETVFRMDKSLKLENPNEQYDTTSVVDVNLQA